MLQKFLINQLNKTLTETYPFSYFLPAVYYLWEEETDCVKCKRKSSKLNVKYKALVRFFRVSGCFLVPVSNTLNLIWYIFYSIATAESNFPLKVTYYHVIKFWDFSMFYQFFLSPQVKWCAIITYKHGIYELPHKLPKELRLRIL